MPREVTDTEQEAVSGAQGDAPEAIDEHPLPPPPPDSSSGCGSSVPTPLVTVASSNAGFAVSVGTERGRKNHEPRPDIPSPLSLVTLGGSEPSGSTPRSTTPNPGGRDLKRKVNEMHDFMSDLVAQIRTDNARVSSVQKGPAAVQRDPLGTPANAGTYWAEKQRTMQIGEHMRLYKQWVTLEWGMQGSVHAHEAQSHPDLVFVRAQKQAGMNMILSQQSADSCGQFVTPPHDKGKGRVTVRMVSASTETAKANFMMIINKHVIKFPQTGSQTIFLSVPKTRRKANHKAAKLLRKNSLSQHASSNGISHARP